MKQKLFYIRDIKHFPIAAIAVSYNQPQERLVFTWAVWNKHDKFSKKKFAEIANGRLANVLRSNYKANDGFHSLPGTDGTKYGCVYFSAPEGKISGAQVEEVIIEMISEEKYNRFTVVPHKLIKTVELYIKFDNLVENLIDNLLGGLQAAIDNDNSLLNKRVQVSTTILERNVSVGVA